MHPAIQSILACRYPSLTVFLLFSIPATVLVSKPRQINFPSYLMMLIPIKCFTKGEIFYIIIKQYLFCITNFAFGNHKELLPVLERYLIVTGQILSSGDLAF